MNENRIQELVLFLLLDLVQCLAHKQTHSGYTIIANRINI